MAQLIGIISDVHATPAPVAEAISIFRKSGVEQIFCVGDIVGYGEEPDQTVALLKESGCRSVIGNHDLWYLNRVPEERSDVCTRFLGALPRVLNVTIEGRKLCFVHASPPESVMKGIHLLDETGNVMPDPKKIWKDYLKHFEYDILIVGHTHQVFAEKIGATLVINPGSTKFNHTCGILSLPGMKYQIVPLSGKAPLMVWNWGIFRAKNENDGFESLVK